MSFPHVSSFSRESVAAQRTAMTRNLAIVALLSMAIAACSRSPADAGAGAGSMPPAQVTVETVELRTVPLSIELPATLAGSREVEIRARVTGILEKRNFDEGATVKRGRSLFTLDSAPFATAVARNEADLLAAQARLDQARRNHARIKPLREERAISQKDLDDAASAEAIAHADVKAVEARLREARLNLGYTRVESPIDGVAGRALASDGTLVSGPEMLLTRVTQTNPMHARFGLSGQEQLRLRGEVASGTVVLPEGGRWKASVKLPDGTLHAETGVVNFSDVRIDANTGTSEMQAVVPNNGGVLQPGQFVRVVLEGAQRRDAIVVPQRAVLDNGTGKYVYLLGQGEKGMTIAQPAPVEVGEWVRGDGKAGDNGWVIAKGLKAGDLVIVDGMARIFFPGMPVQLAKEGKPDAGPLAPAAAAAH